MIGAKRAVSLVLLLLSVTYKNNVNGFTPLSIRAVARDCTFCSSSSKERDTFGFCNISYHKKKIRSSLPKLYQSARNDSDDGLLSVLQQQYVQLTDKYYLAMAAIQSGTIAFGADVITQNLEGVEHVDYSHVFAIVAVAATASGSFNAFWLRRIEARFPGRDPKYVAVKALISTLLLGGAINVGYIIGIPLLSSTIFAPAAHLPLDPQVWFAGWTNEEFVTLTKVECSMFLPYHLLAFNLVPPEIRPLTQAGMAGTFNVAVSAVTLGLFDCWVTNVGHAVHLFGLQ